MYVEYADQRSICGVILLNHVTRVQGESKIDSKTSKQRERERANKVKS